MKEIETNRFNRLEFCFYFILSNLAVLAVNLLFFNRYLPITEGWFTVMGQELAQGKTLYRDVYSFLPPLYPWLMMVWVKVIGVDLIYLRVFGILIILGIQSVLFLLIKTFIRLDFAALTSVFLILFYQSGEAHITYDFLQIMYFFLLLGLYLLITAASTGSVNQKDLNRIFFAGVCMSTGALIKHSNGSIFVFFTLIGYILALLNQGKGQIRVRLPRLLLGLASPVLFVVLVLIVKGSFLEFLQQILVGAIKSKGSLGEELFNWTRGLQSYDSLAAFALILFFSQIVYREHLLLPFHGIEVRSQSHRQRMMGVIALVLCLWFLLLASIYPEWRLFGMVFTYEEWKSWPLYQWFIPLVNYRFILPVGLTFLGALIAAWQCLRKAPSVLTQQTALFSLGTIGAMIGGGTSAALSEASVFPALGFVYCLYCNKRSYKAIGPIFVLVALGVGSLHFLHHKLEAPYDWWTLNEPSIAETSEYSKIKELQGFKLSPKTNEMYEKIYSTLREIVKPDDQLFVFPATPVLYQIAHKSPPLKSISQWFDILPDDVAIHEAVELSQIRPSIIAEVTFPEFVWTNHEWLFRQGRACGQRTIRDTIHRIISEDNYQLVLNIPVSNNNQVNLLVWKRNSKHE